MSRAASPQVATIPRMVEEGSGRGVLVYAGPNTAPEPSVLQRLLTISKLPWVAAPVIALPDLHWKERLETPSSTAVATESDIVMSFSSPSQNCGMNLLATPLGEEDLSDAFLDVLMDRLREQIPRRRRNPALTRGEVIEFCRKGAPAASTRFGLDPSACVTMEAGGNALAGEEPSSSELSAAVDEKSLQIGRWSFAYIGGGNHFLELQVVTQVLDRTACDIMGLAEGRLVAMFHTGSERLGHDLGRLYSWRRKTDPRRRRKLFWRKVALHLLRDMRGPAEMRRRWAYHFARRDYVGVPAGSHEGARLDLTLKVAANYGYANRVAVMGLIQEAFRKATGKRDLALGLVADLSHNTVQRERVEGRDLWVHRHNAARVVGPSGLPADHPYRAIGQPVMVPGTNRTGSFVIVGMDGASRSLYSVDHGAGRTVERFEQEGLLASVAGRSTRKYTYAQPGPDLLPHLSDDAIEEVMSVASAGGIARPAARLRPVAVLKA
ncbi:MAG TPA: RtcB family protein [Candidatus Polarisedimenticolia bacterium]|nr:RtcB family protein [Candidatus Polarisedimenticolia bacterium]